MAITVTCEQCGTLVAAPDSAAGKKGRCTVCGKIVDLPAPSAPEPGPAPGLHLSSEPAPVPEIPALRVEPPLKPILPVAKVDSPIGQSRPVVLSPADGLARPTQKPAQKTGRSCALAALIALGIMSLTVTVVALLLFIYVLPAIENLKREVAGISLLKHIEHAQDGYFEKAGEYAQRVSGKVASLESAGVISADEAAAEAPPGPGRPVRGYLVRILTQQGKSAPGGGKLFLDARGKMTGGFALLAYPADYGTAKKTFLRSADGTIYSKDLGEKTAVEAAAIQIFEIDPTWKMESAPTPPEGRK